MGETEKSLLAGEIITIVILAWIASSKLKTMKTKLPLHSKHTDSMPTEDVGFIHCEGGVVALCMGETAEYLVAGEVMIIIFSSQFTAVSMFKNICVRHF